MPIKLPPEGHPVRALVDVNEVLALTPATAKALPTVPEGRAIARERLKAAKPTHAPNAPQYKGAPPLCNVLVISENGYIMLIGVNPRGIYKVRWNFGNVTQVSCN